MTQDRILHLATGHNFRDIGGYPTHDGRSVKWRQVFRSGYMSSVTGEDAAQLHALGIDTICDLRATGERETRPTRWHTQSSTELWARDYEFSSGALSQLVQRPDVMHGDMHAAMITIYQELPFEQADSYRELFRRLAAGRVPMVFNCSAGKDRTGLASALLLSVLGVPRDVIEEDYLLTNATIDGLISYMETESHYSNFVSSRREHAMPLLRAEPEYLATSYDVIAARHGTVDSYMSDVLGITAADQDAIRAHLLV